MIRVGKDNNNNNNFFTTKMITKPFKVIKNLITIQIVTCKPNYKIQPQINN